MRRNLATARELLDLISRDLDDLHELAYTKPHRSAVEERVRGGERDYALDRHGDLRARKLLEELDQTAVCALEVLGNVDREARRFLNARGIRRTSARR